MNNRSVFADLIYSLIIISIYFLIMFFAFHNSSPFSYLSDTSVVSALIIIITTILGVIAVVITLFSIFEDAFKNNRIIKILKDENYFIQIFKRYSDSIFVMFFSIIVITITWIMSNNLKNLAPYLLAIMAFAIVISFIRMYRCFKIFKLLTDAISDDR